MKHFLKVLNSRYAKIPEQNRPVLQQLCLQEIPVQLGPFNQIHTSQARIDDERERTIGFERFCLDQRLVGRTDACSPELGQLLWALSLDVDIIHRPDYPSLSIGRMRRSISRKTALDWITNRFTPAGSECK